MDKIIKQNEIPIIFITDNNYVLPTAVAINSLIKNKKEQSFYRIFILHNNVLEEYQHKFLEYNRSDVVIEFIKPENSEFLLSIKEKKEYDYISPSVLLKFAIPKVFKDFEKVLYIDGDTIINGDLSDLYNTDISEVYAGVVKDAHPILSGSCKRLNIDTYFNAGVILYNISKILSDGIDDYLNSDDCLIKTKKYLYFEQDTYNVVFSKNVKFLSPKYNFIAESWQYYGIKRCSQIFEISVKEANDLFNNAVIFHLASEMKPWLYKDGLMRKMWEYYYTSSPFTFIPIGNRIFNPVKNLNFLQKLFSIVTECKGGKKHKIIVILGIKFKIIIKSPNLSDNKKNSTKTKIIVCYHKDSYIFRNDVLLPIHVGKEISANTILDIEKDNTGENISAKNPYYCELTGLYWLWKNVKAENYGLFHYRRFLDIRDKYSKKDPLYPSLLHLKDWNGSIIDSQMELYDVILPNKNEFELNMYDYYKRDHVINDFDIVIDIIKKDYPQYINACEKSLNHNKCYFYNMFIMKKNLFNEYCTWLFDILQKAESQIDLKGRDSYQRRAFGFLGERLLNIFVQYKTETNQNIKIKTVNNIFINDDPLKRISFGVGEYIQFPTKKFLRLGNIKFTHHIKGSKRK